MYLHVDKEVRYCVETQDGNSGAPLLCYAGGFLQCYVVVGVHVRRAADDQPPYKVASVLTTDFLKKVMERI